MDRTRGLQPPAPPSAATTRPPPLVTMVTILLRPREEPAPRASPAAPTMATSTAAPFGASAGGSMDVEGVPLPAPEPMAPVVSAAAGTADGESPDRFPPSSAVGRTTSTGPLSTEEESWVPASPPPHAAQTMAICTSPLFRASAGGSMDVEGVPPPAPEPMAPVVSAAAGTADGESPDRPSPSSAVGRTTSMGPLSMVSRTISTAPHSLQEERHPLHRTLSIDTELLLMPSDNQWSELLPELLLQIACCLRPSRHDLEQMRGVCQAWRMIIPSTLDPFLVLSRKEPGARSEILLLEIARSLQPENASFKVKAPLSQPPVGTSCWGSALGLLALQCHHENCGDIFVYCIHCAQKKEMLSLPERAMPNAVFLEPLTPQRFVLMTMGGGSGDALLRVDSYDYPWRDGGPWWLPTHGFGDAPLRSMALLPGVFRAGATKDSIIIIDESGRCLDSPFELVEIKTPPIARTDGSMICPWELNGHHLFICERQLYFVEVFDSTEAAEGVGARSFMVKKSKEGVYALLPVSSIGEFSVFLGPNQSIVLPSDDPLIGRRSNTLYVEDFRGHVRQPNMLAINLQSLETAVIPYPDEPAAEIADSPCCVGWSARTQRSC